MNFSVTVLGSCSATPTLNRFTSSQIVHYENKLFLIDCGEGAQMQLRRFNIKINRINHIFISHLHGDHYLGLMGLLSSYHLLGRKTDLHIYSPKALEEIIEIQKQAAATTFSYKIIFHYLKEDNEGVIYEDEKLTVSSVKLQHRVPTFGFIFKEKKKEKKIYKEAIAAYSLSIADILNIKKGIKFIDKKGNMVPEQLLTYPEEPVRMYAYISDTAYDESVVKKIYNIDLLYHEATFGEDLKQVAAEKFHSTALEAATIAKMAKAKKLIIGHFSARYTTFEPLLKEARSVFENTFCAEEGLNFIV